MLLETVVRVVASQSPLRCIFGHDLGCPSGWRHGVVDRAVVQSPSGTLEIVYKEEILLPSGSESIYRICGTQKKSLFCLVSPLRGVSFYVLEQGQPLMLMTEVEARRVFSEMSGSE